ncbi:YdeI/OmpD-associated family protein [Deinococcus sp.]|uniref:YdeI/OmpD-associated family protein n=1 Tax=Deinococcus sp. TaxID=47478 RepID=UPI0025D31587|nr:YdeI/OmpD-associated family protein [Deinococcus sp.]
MTAAPPDIFEPDIFEPDTFEPNNRAAWREWPLEHHATASGVRCVLHKKSAADAAVEALCFGWSDSVGRKLDERRSTLYFAPRKKGSGWSAVNKARIEQLEVAGLLHASGLARILAAKRDGSWTLLGSVDALAVPPDLQTALEGAGALARWTAFVRSARRGIPEWIVQAKTAPTRARRIEETARLAAQGERANRWRKKA